MQNHLLFQGNHFQSIFFVELLMVFSSESNLKQDKEYVSQSRPIKKLQFHWIYNMSNKIDKYQYIYIGWLSLRIKVMSTKLNLNSLAIQQIHIIKVYISKSGPLKITSISPDSHQDIYSILLRHIPNSHLILFRYS